MSDFTPMGPGDDCRVFKVHRLGDVISPRDRSTGAVDWPPPLPVVEEQWWHQAAGLVSHE